MAEPKINWKECLKEVEDCEDVDELVEWTKHEVPEVRLAAAKRMCPC